MFGPHNASSSPPDVQAAVRPQCAWLTLDQYDRESLPFLAYVAGAIERAVPGALTHTMPLLRFSDPPAPALVLQALLVDLNALTAPLTLVLDDYHLITAEAIHHSVAYLLRHLPEQCRLVVISRTDPPLPLVRLRAERHVTELRAAQLRFTEHETSELLHQLYGAPPDPTYAAQLFQDTEGWPIALQLAVLVQQATPSRTNLAEVKHQLAEYLAEEVFAQQPAAIQQALLAFAVPERFCARLGAALLDQAADPDSAEQLIERMLQDNLMLTPLTGAGDWYRFHPLLRDLLLRRLRLTYDQAQVQALQRRAARWFAASGLYAEAVQLYLTAGDEAAAGALVEQLLHRELGRDIATIAPDSWLSLLPATLIEQRPGLTLIKARIAAYQMDVPGALACLEQADKLRAALHEHGAGLPWPTFDGDLAIVRGTVLYYAHSSPAVVMDVLWRGLRLGAVPSLAASALAFLARTYAAAGRYDEGVRLLTDLPAVAPDVTIQLAPLVRHTALCMVHEFVGRIDDLAREAQRFTATLAATQPPGAWALFAAAFRARAAYEQARMDAAAADFAQVRARKYETNAHTYIGCLIGLGQIAAAQGALADAAVYEQEIWEFTNEVGSAFLRNEALGFTVRMALLRRDLPAALDAAHQITADTHFGTRAWYAIAPPQLSRAGALIAAGDAASLQQADALIAALIAAVEPVHNLRPLVAAQVMQALLRKAQGRSAEALKILERVTERAAPPGLIRTIVDCGPELQPLLQQLAERGGAPAYVHKLLTFYEAAPSAPRPAIAPVEQNLPEMLTRRELDILALLAERFADKEIAERLVITANTVRKHTSAIYSKLGVSSRREAVEVARSLGLLR
jgi:LuxR family maltose regulon positive regulatory protein